MPKRKPTKMVPAKKQADGAAAMRKALAKQSKAELVELVVQLAREDRAIFRKLAARYDVATAPHELVAATRRAIREATDFDDRDINRNFDYDYEAYGEVQRNLTRLIDAEQLPTAMELSLELMKAGSYQVEMSDEGLMTRDLEDCLSVVIEAATKSQLPAEEVIAWCQAMLANDRVQFIATKQLQALRDRFSQPPGKPRASRK